LRCCLLVNCVYNIVLSGVHQPAPVMTVGLKTDRSFAEFSGLEILIGFPVFSSDKAILKAMMEEHNKAGHGTEKFKAWNAEVERTTT
jgi:hypothetical protein